MHARVQISDLTFSFLSFPPLPGKLGEFLLLSVGANSVSALGISGSVVPGAIFGLGGLFVGVASF